MTITDCRFFPSIEHTPARFNFRSRQACQKRPDSQVVGGPPPRNHQRLVGVTVAIEPSQFSCKLGERCIGVSLQSR
jgi:hypothetical protein